MTEYFDEQGNKVEAFTPEEVETRLEEARLAAIEDANAAREDEITVLNTQLEEKEVSLTEAKAQLEKEANKEKNLGGQRKVIETKEEEIGKLKEEITTLKTDLEGKIQEAVKTLGNNKIDGMIEKISGDDTNLKQKIRFHYDNFKGEPKDDKEITERIKNAYTLATGGQPSLNISGEIVSGAGTPPIPNLGEQGSKISPGAVDVAHKLGATDQDLKKNKLI